MKPLKLNPLMLVRGSVKKSVLSAVSLIHIIKTGTSLVDAKGFEANSGMASSSSELSVPDFVLSNLLNRM